MRCHESQVVRCYRCGQIWVGHEGERCTFCVEYPARIDWRRVLLTLAAVALIASAMAVAL